MMWGKKKSKELPDLPPLPPQYGSEGMDEEESSSLPSFPDSAMEKGFSQTAIKEAVSEDEEDMPEPPETNMNIMEIETKSEKKEDLFVKVDKFASARKSLETAQNKIDEMQELLKVIRETKMREEQELAYWEKELTSAKAHVQQVTENIFGKIE